MLLTPSAVPNDELNRPRTVTEAAGKTLTYSYDAVGNRATLTDPDGGLTTYSYDSRNQLSWLLNPYTERSTWVYDVIGRVTTMTHGNGSLAETDYDGAGRTAAVRNLKADRSVLSVFTYSYDNAGNRTAVAEANGDLVTWSYDETYQLTRERRSGASAYDITYSYDAVGNRLSKIDGGAVTTYSYDGANQLTVESAPGGLTTYTYDANGNTAVINAAGSLTTYAWDIENHLTGAQLPAGARTTATYDGDGKRRTYHDSAGLKRIVWDAENLLMEADSGGSTVARYAMNPQAYGELVSQRRSGASAFYHYDALGSTRALTNAAQTPTDTADYKAFGLANASSGSTTNPFRWVGRLGYYWQPDTSDHWLRARVYRPQVGRFVSRDPLLQANRYGWPRTSPVGAVDPSGRQVSVSVGGPHAQPFPTYQCENQEEYCCKLKWGYGPPRTLVFPDYTVKKKVWHTDVRCDCKNDPPTCRGMAHRQNETWENRKLTNLSPEMKRPVTGKCVGLAPADCFGKEYSKRIRPTRQGEFYRYQKACDQANAICGSHKTCNPCGPGGGGAAPLKGGCQNAEEDADWLRLQCGPLGADKLAHCYGFCMAEKCVPGLGWALYLLQLKEEDDPLDLYADLLGIGCSDSVFGCLSCCMAATYDIAYAG